MNTSTQIEYSINTLQISSLDLSSALSQAYTTGATTNPAIPKSASITSMAHNNSQARAWTSPPTMRAFVKYSSLWIATRNPNEAIPTPDEMPRLITTITAFEIRLPTTGSNPVTKVNGIRIAKSGR